MTTTKQASDTNPPAGSSRSPGYIAPLKPRTAKEKNKQLGQMYGALVAYIAAFKAKTIRRYRPYKLMDERGLEPMETIALLKKLGTTRAHDSVLEVNVTKYMSQITNTGSGIQQVQMQALLFLDPSSSDFQNVFDPDVTPQQLASLRANMANNPSYVDCHEQFLESIEWDERYTPADESQNQTGPLQTDTPTIPSDRAQTQDRSFERSSPATLPPERAQTPHVPTSTETSLQQRQPAQTPRFRTVAPCADFQLI